YRIISLFIHIFDPSLSSLHLPTPVGSAVPREGEEGRSSSLEMFALLSQLSCQPPRDRESALAQLQKYKPSSSFLIPLSLPPPSLISSLATGTRLITVPGSACYTNEAMITTQAKAN